MKRLFAFAVAILALSVGVRSANAAPAKTLLTRPVTVELRPQKPAILLGEPTFVDFVVHNSTNKEWNVLVGGDYGNRLGRPNSFQIEVRDEKGGLVAQPDARSCVGGAVSGQKIPVHGESIFSLFLPHWATFSKPGRYRITAKKTLQLYTSDEDFFTGAQKLVAVPAQTSTTVEVLPADGKKLGAIINTIGESVLLLPTNSVNYRDQDATKLRAIDDPRVVPVLIRSVKRSNPDIFDILRLGHFNDDAAFETLQKLALHASASDITNTATRELAIQSAGEIRHCAALAIADSPHEGATEVLLSLRHDPYGPVRLTVVQNIGKLPLERSRAIWREMSSDSDADVASEAKRYLEESQKAH